jgi:quercetin dioxygenase-like cupin family protein
MHFSIKSIAILLALTAVSPVHAAEVIPDPKVLDFKIPAKIPWGPVSAGGSQQALLFGDPNKPGLYVLLNKWLPGHMSKPHFHKNDRFITVISGTWWIGTGDTWNPALTTPMPAGSFVHHYANQVHWDGAKDEETVIEIVGMGPAESIPSPTAK